MANSTQQQSLSTRKLPFNYEAEQAVLGAVLASQDATLVILNELKENDFYAHEHQIIFNAMHRLFSKANNPIIDPITLKSELETHNELETIGGMSYIARLVNAIPTATNFTYYMDIVKHDSVCRQLINAGGKIIEEAQVAEDSESALSYSEALIYAIAEKADHSTLEQIRPSLTDVLSEFDEAFQNPGGMVGLSTGFAGLDMLTNGMHGGEIIQLAARPSVGKTALALNIATHVAVHQKKPVAIFSLEMPKVKLARRIVASVAQVDSQAIIRGELNEADQRKFRQAIAALADAPIYIDDSSLNTPGEILSKCRRIKNDKNRGLSFVVIDYIGLMKAGGRGYDGNRQQEISDISRSLKIMAMELNVPILVLSQLNRSVESRTDHRPMLSDLRDSGSIEQDADVVMFIYKSERYRDLKENEVEQGVAEIIVEKNRNGGTGTVKLKWDGSTTTFSNMPEDVDKQSLQQTAPPRPKRFEEDYEKAKQPPVEINDFDDSVFEQTPPPEAIPEEVRHNDDFDELFDDAQPDDIAKSLKDEK